MQCNIQVPVTYMLNRMFYHVLFDLQTYYDWIRGIEDKFADYNTINLTEVAEVVETNEIMRMCKFSYLNVFIIPSTPILIYC